MQNIKVTAIALAVSAAGFVANADAATTTVGLNAVVQVGCSVPSATGASVYSIDATTNAQSSGSTAYNTVGIPTAVVAGASCTQAVSSMLVPTSGAGCLVATAGSTGSWDLASDMPTNLTVSGSSYSLQAYNFTCQ
jgi:hypothetical protein